MICHKIGLPPISIMGLGFRWVSSEMRVPRPPANMTAFIMNLCRSYLVGGIGPAKDIGGAFKQLLLLLSDMVGVQVELLAKLGHGATSRLKTTVYRGKLRQHDTNFSRDQHKIDPMSSLPSHTDDHCPP